MPSTPKPLENLFREIEEFIETLKYGESVEALANRIASLPANDGRVLQLTDAFLQKTNDRELGHV